MVVRLVCEDVKAITPNWSNVKEVVPITEPVDLGVPDTLTLPNTVAMRLATPKHGSQDGSMLGTEKDALLMMEQRKVDLFRES